MPTTMHCYAETRTRNGEWTADQAATFYRDPPNTVGRSLAHMIQIKASKDARLFGLLADGVEHSWPWSWCAWDLPRDASPEVQALAECCGVDGHSHSHLDLQQLLAKSQELMFDPREDAWLLQSLLLPLIRSLVISAETAEGVMQATEPGALLDPEAHRIVFWFEQ